MPAFLGILIVRNWQEMFSTSDAKIFASNLMLVAEILVSLMDPLVMLRCASR